jgi:hypothetical protein
MKTLLIILSLGLFVLVKSQNFITPTIVTTLASDLNETSGLINLDGEIWTHTDNGGETELYQINLINGNIIRTVKIHNANNVDWEDIACDETYVYIGDFGNNDGSRTNLRVYRVNRADIASSNDVDAEKIHFSYSDQTSFEPNYHYTNFDCEALTCYQDKLYLFTKNWIDNQTKVYELSNEPGTYTAEYLASFEVNCLITGAEMVPALNTLLLIGYNESGGSYTWLFSNFSGADFFGGSNTKLIWTMLTQVEGICYAGNSEAYACSEKFAGVLDPTLYTLDLSGYMTQIDISANPQIQIFTDHSNIVIVAENGKTLKGNLQILTLDGMVLSNQKIENESVTKIPINHSAGIYLARYQEGTFLFTRKLIIF